MPNSRRFRPADATDDGSGGRFVRGLPADAAGLKPDPQVDYHTQGGAPTDRSGGTFKLNVDRSGQPYKPAPGAPDPKPFKLK